MVSMKTAKQNADWVIKKHGRFFERLIAEAVALVEAPGPLDTRARRVLEITDDLAAKVAPKAACRRRCSHCCHQSTVISEWEAARIARYTGRTAAVIPKITREMIGPMRTRYTGVPCVFLKRGECSIYPVRPLACRVHFNMGDDPSVCDIAAHPGGKVPYFNFAQLKFAHGVLFFKAGCTFADVRDYFPAAAVEPAPAKIGT
jgi:uncharacterized protein